MDAIFIILLVTSLPVFYIWGIVSFILWLSRMGKQAPAAMAVDRKMLLRFMTAELERWVSLSPDTRAEDVLKSLQQEMNASSAQPNATATASGQAAVALSQPALSSQPQFGNPATQMVGNTPIGGSAAISKSVAAPRPDWFSVWYEQHSIDLLLYVGALLVLASASIFVGFQWVAIPGLVKAMMLTGVMVTFGGCGLVFYQAPKIRQAGAVFTGIGALLVPLAGTAWYVFVLRDMGVRLGIAWLITALITLLVQVGMLVYFEQSVYGYAASLSGIAVVMSLVEVFGLPTETFVAAGVVGCLGLLLGYVRWPLQERWRGMALAPMQLTSQVCLPIFLVYGLFVTLGNGSFYSYTTAGTLILAIGYYVLSYGLVGQPWQLLMALGLWPLAGLSLEGIYGWPAEIRLYVLDGFGVVWLLLAEGLQRLRKTVEWQGAFVIASVLLAAAMLLSLGSSALQQALIATIALAGVLMLAAVCRKLEVLYLALLLLGLVCFEWLGRVWGGTHWMEYLSGLYWLISLACFGLTLVARREKVLLGLGVTGVVGFIGVALIFAVLQPWLVVGLALTALGMAVVACYHFDEPDLALVAGASGYGLALAILWASKASGDVYWLCLVGVSYAEYGLSLVLPKDMAARWQQTSVVGAVVVPAVAYIQAPPFTASQTVVAEMWSLSSAYASIALLAWHGALAKQTSFWYGASVMGVFAYVWQLQVWNMTETQWYSLPIGLYCLGLAWLRRRVSDESNASWLELLGLGLLVGVTMFQAFGADNPIYSLVLLLYGVCLLGAGVSLRQALYKYAGLVAIVLGVIARTYTFFFMLPKWAIVGLLGLIFLGVAMWLMWKRGDDHVKL